MVEVARGWGGHNIIYRLDTTSGSWAIKALLRELDELTTERFDIELRAFEGQVPMARPVPASAGPVAVLDGVPLRCHEWIDGVAKTNEDTDPAEAGRMGQLISHLHGLSLPWSRRFDEPPNGDILSWSALAQ